MFFSWRSAHFPLSLFQVFLKGLFWLRLPLTILFIIATQTSLSLAPELSYPALFFSVSVSSSNSPRNVFIYCLLFVYVSPPCHPTPATGHKLHKCRDLCWFFMIQDTCRNHNSGNRSSPINSKCITFHFKAHMYFIPNEDGFYSLAHVQLKLLEFLSKFVT